MQSKVNITLAACSIKMRDCYRIFRFCSWTMISPLHLTRHAREYATYASKARETVKHKCFAMIGAIIKVVDSHPHIPESTPRASPTNSAGASPSRTDTSLTQCPSKSDMVCDRLCMRVCVRVQKETTSTKWIEQRIRKELCG